MKKPTLLYIPLILLFALCLTAFITHAGRVILTANRISGLRDSVRSPIKSGGVIDDQLPEIADAGAVKGDSVIRINGRELSNDSYLDELLKTHPGDPINLTIERKDANGETEQKELVIKAAEKKVTLAGTLANVGLLLVFNVLFPGLSFLLGFYVVAVRPRDALAWVLLGVLLGVGSIGLEGGNEGTLQYFFQESALNFFGLLALIFALYFPERWDFDRRFPFVKWLLIVPLGLSGFLNLIEQFGRLFNIPAIWETVNNLTEPFDSFISVLSIIGVTSFFFILGVKSGMVEHKDSRRRLRILHYGTAIAMTPAFCIVLYRILSGNTKASFFELVPAWFAFTSLVVLLLFPLTMAYVIVVERAMDVSVVVRQGLQYALARNGVIVVQILLSIIIIFAAVSLVSNAETNVWLKIIFISVGILANILVGKLANLIKLWTDRRFFREAYNSEQILSDLSEEVRTMVETRPLLETVSNKISQSLHVPQVTFLLKNGLSFYPAYALGFADSPPVSFDEKKITVDKLRKNEAVTVYADDTKSWVNTENLDGERENLEKLNSQLLLPVGVKEKLLGFLSLSPKKSEEPYTANDLRLLKSVAAQTGLALENSRLTEAIVSETALRERLNREVEIAREVQERLFPQDLPTVKGLDYWGACRPALGVGGDYYDFFELENDKFGIAIGDVSGKGIGASLMMASLQATLRGQAIHFDEDLATLMCNVNRLVYETSTSNRYATFFYSQFDPATRKLTYVNAGHNAPFLFRRTNGKDYELIRLETGGAVVGMLPPMLISYEQGEIEMQPGDLLIGFTDGISEAMNSEDEEWGEERMIEAVKAKIDLPAREMLDYLVVCADNFAGGAKQHDDMTAIIVRLI